MPLLTTFGNAGTQSFGTAGIQPGGSALFAGGVRALSVAPSANFAYGTGNFTVEAWVRPSSYSSWRILFAQSGVYNSRAYWYFLFYLDRFTGQLAFQMNPYYTIHPTALTLNVWSHVAVVRNSGSLRLYVNGNGNSAISAPTNLTDQTVRPTIGNYSRVADQSAGQDFQGYITNLRVTRSAVYTANFAPSRTPFTRTSQGATNTQLLLNHRTSGTLITDSSANALTVTNTGSVSFSTLSPYTEPYVTPPTIVIVSVTVTPSTNTVSEGGTVTFTVAGTNTTNGTYYYSIEETGGGSGTLTGADFSTGSLSGTFTITSNSGSIPLTVVRDLTTEGDESFSLFVRSGSVTGTVLGSSSIIDITDSSLTPAFTVTPASVDEGNSAAFTVQNLGPDGTYYWTVLNGTSANADFTATSGSFTVSGSTGGIDNGSGSFSVTTVADRTTEGAETFQVQVRSGSVSGPVLVTSASVTINDTSLPPAFTVTPASINEGATGTFTVTNLGPAGTYYYTFLHGTTTSADFGGLTGGTITTTSLNQTRNILVGPSTGQTTEGPETFQLEVRTGSLTGPVILTSASVTVNDTSLTPSVTVISTATAGSIVTPAGYSFVTVEAVGGGGGGFGSGISSQQAGGGGGAYARTANLIVTGGSTIVYYSVGSVATDSWVRVGTNAPPTTTFQGCLGAAGGNASNSTSGLGGTAAASIGNTEFSGGDGGRGGTGSPNGGGGAGDSGNGVTVPAGTNTVGTGGTGTNIVGGTGGVLATPSGNDPGGGGYGSGVGLQTNGGIGRVRIVFTTQSV